MKKKKTNQNSKVDKSISNESSLALDLANSIIDTTSDGIIGTNLEGEITFWNNGSTKMYKYSKDEILGKHVTLLYKPDNEISAEDRIKGILEGKSYFNDEVKVLDKFNNTLTVLMSLNGVKDEKGEISLVVGITKNISKEKLAQQALEDSEQKFHQAFDNSPIPISLLNLKTKKRLAVNNAFCNTFGYTEEELVNEENFKKNNIAVDQKEFNLIYNKILKEGTVFEYPFSMYTKSGEVRETLLNATRISPENKDIYITSYLDVTDKKKVENALISSEKKFRNLANTAQVAIAILSEPPNNKFIYVNPYWEELTGYSGKEAKKLSAMDIVAPDFHKVLSKEALDQESKGSKSGRKEFKIRTKSGLDKWVSFTAAKIDFEGQNAVLRTGLDITEQKNNEQRLLVANESIKKGKNYLDNILNNIGDPIFVKDEKSRLILVNDSFCAFLSLKRENIIGKTLAEDIPPKEQEIFLNIDKQVLKTGKENTNEELLTVKGGETKTIVTRKTRYIDNSGKKYLIGVIRDITKRKKTEIELKKAQEIAKMGSWYLDISSGEITWSDELFKMYGLDPNLPIPPLSEHKKFLSQESWELLNSSIKHISITGEAYAVELRTKKRSVDKNWQWFFAKGEAVVDSDDNIIAVRGTAQDITERKIAEEKLIENEKKLKAIFDHHFQLTGMLDAKGKILDVNRTALEFAGLKKEEVIGQYFWKTPWWETSQKAIVKSAIFDAARGKHVRFETTNVNKHNEVRIFDFSLNPVQDSRGKVIYLVPEGRDITDLKKTEQKLAQTNADLTAAVASLNELKKQLEDQNIYLRKELDLVFNFEEMVYGSALFGELLANLERVAPTDATVLILGESGTGKELLARALHNLSLRKHKPFIKVNCSAIPNELIESELFGHKKGSFTGAVSDKVGKFELAKGGTLFLDEIGDLPLAMQPKLLRFLQEGEMEVVGGTTTKSLDVRIVAATNKDLKKEVSKDLFREDLFFRLNVFPLEVPPLRDRKEDIPILIEHFSNKYGKKYRKNIKYVSDSAMHAMSNYNWPGNIRELENLIERSVILSDTETLIMPGFSAKNGKKRRQISNNKQTLNDVQRSHILGVLEKTDWKINGPEGAALILDIKPSTLRDKMKKLGIERPIK